MCHMRIGETIVTSAMLLCMPGFHFRNFFSGWDWSTVLITTALLGDTWLSGLMVKYLSSVTKTVAKSSSLALLYIIALATGQQLLRPAQFCSAVVIVVSTALFACISSKQINSKK